MAAKGITGMYDAEGNPVAGDVSKTVKDTLATLDNTTYATSQRTGEVVSNIFEDRDINYFIDGAVTYLTRSDWNTFPDTVTTLTATDEIKDLMENFQYEKPADAPDVSAFKHKQENGISFIDMKDVPFDDPKWEKLAQEKGIEQNVEFCGMIHNVNDFYEKATVHVVTSRYEGFLMTLLESMAHGLPTVAFEMPNLTLAKKERGVINVDMNDTTSAAIEVVKLLSTVGDISADLLLLYTDCLKKPVIHAEHHGQVRSR